MSWFSGVEFGGLVEFASVTGSVSAVGSGHSGTGALLCNPVGTGLGSVTSGTFANGEYALAQFFVRWDASGLPPADSEEFFGFSGSARIRVFDDGTVQWFDGVSSLGSRSTIGMEEQRWHRIDVLERVQTVTTFPEVGEVFIDGRPAANFSLDLGDTLPNFAVFGKETDRNGEGISVRFDDIRLGGFASRPALFAPQRTVRLGPVTGSPTYDDFNKSTGSDMFPLVDEQPPNDDTDWVESADAVQLQSTQLADVSAVIGAGETIELYQYLAWARRTNGGVKVLETLRRINSTDDFIDRTLTTAYELLRHPAAPGVGSASIASLDGIEVGGRRNSSGNGMDLRISTASVMVCVSDGLPSELRTKLQAVHRLGSW